MGLENRLIALVQENFDPEDIWPDLHDGTDCYGTLNEALSAAQDEGWVDPADPQTYDVDGVLAMAERLGLTIGPSTRTIDAYHDDNGHTGAVQWCNHPMCSREEN